MLAAASSLAPPSVGGPPPWSPLDLTPALWIDPSDVSTVTISGGGVNEVAQIDDKSGNGRHLVQGTLASMPKLVTDPTSGLTVLSFDGVNDRMKTASADALAAPFGVAAVIKMPVTLPAGGYLFDSQLSNTDVLLRTLSSTSLRIYAGTSLTIASVVSAGELLQVSATFDGSSSSVRKNGSPIGSGNIGSGTLELLTLGSSASGSGGTWWEGTVHEIIFWPNPTSFTAVENYLKTKWGTP